MLFSSLSLRLSVNSVFFCVPKAVLLCGLLTLLLYFPFKVVVRYRTLGNSYYIGVVSEKLPLLSVRVEGHAQLF